jgi:hypothetical protein
MFIHPSIRLEIVRQRQENLLARRGPARELAQRLSGTDEVLLLWHPESKRVELSVRDLATGEGFQLEVAPGSAIDAFHHPYAYVARRENADRVVSFVATNVDG